MSEDADTASSCRFGSIIYSAKPDICSAFTAGISQAQLILAEAGNLIKDEAQGKKTGVFILYAPRLFK
jgi:hypothetical protein